MRINGKEEILNKSMTVREYLSDNAYDEMRVAVELDGKIVKREAFHSTLLNNSSNVEVVSFVGGG